jgi:hypothetical protein
MPERRTIDRPGLTQEPWSAPRLVRVESAIEDSSGSESDAITNPDMAS